MSTANSFTWHLTGRNYWKKTFVGILSLVLINTLSASAAYSDGPNNAAGEKSANTIGTSIRHSSDQNEDFAIDLTELLRVIQFFNSNGFHCATGTEDGFAPGSGDSSCAAHNSDYNPQDWRIDLSELLRLIQFFNSNGYHSQCSSEDFFSPGPGAHYVCEGDGDVEAAFEVSTNHGSAPCKIRFQDTTQYESKDGGLSWRWNFGDGGTSNESNPAHSYLTPGVYTPELIITTVTGKEALFIYPGCIEIDPGTDSDRDGISDVDELVFGTNPSLWDTDRDTFGDGDEISAGTDPLVSNATPADNFLTLDGVDNLDILGMDNDRLILFQRGGSLDKALIISEGMTLYSTASIPRATLSKNGNKGLLDTAWGFIGEVAGVVTNTIQAGETIVYNGVTYLAAATEDGVVYVIQFVTKPLVEAFPNLDQSIQTSFNFSTDDPRLFPGGSPLNDYVVYDQNGLSLTIAEGHMSFSPSLFIRLFIEKGELKTATFRTDGLFYVSLDIRAQAASGFNYDSGDKPIVKASIPIADLPIKVDLELSAEFLFQAAGSASTTLGYDTGSNVTLGVNYLSEDLQNLSSFSLQNCHLHTPVFSLDGNLTAMLVLKPKIDINLYGQAGAYLTLRPNTAFEVNYPCPPAPSLSVGMDSEAGLYADLFGLLETGASVTWPESPLTYTLWQPESCGFLGIPPVADFSASPRNGSTPLRVKFEELSQQNPEQGPNTYLWSFGDGCISQSAAPSHTYQAPGRYTVSLMVANEAGSDIRVFSDYIEVIETSTPPTAAFSAFPRSGIRPLTLNFTDDSVCGSSPIYLWAWDLNGDGLIDSHDRNPAYTYTNEGLYTVHLSVYTNDGRDSASAYQYIRVLAENEGESVEVPTLAGLSQGDAGSAVMGAGLLMGTVTYAYNANFPERYVITQNPRAGTRVHIGSEVHVSVSLGDPGPQDDTAAPTLYDVKLNGYATGSISTARQGDELDFSGSVRDETQLALISFEVAPEGGSSTKFIHESISGTSRSLSSYSFDTGNGAYISGPGTYYITMFVKDSAGNMAQAHWELEIQAPVDNTPPTLSNVTLDGHAAGSAFTAEQGYELDFGGTVRDETQLALISFEVAPEGSSSTKFIHESISGTSHSLSSYSFDTGNGAYISGPGTYYITMFVKDSVGNLAQVHWELEIQAPADNTPPTLSNVTLDGHATGSAFTAEQGYELDFGGTVRDETQLALISFEVAPEGGSSTKFIHESISGTSRSLSSYSFDTGNGAYISGPGTYYITMFVKDSAGNLAQARWELEIQAPADNTPPTLSNVKFDGHATGASFTAEQGDELDFSGTVRDETQLALISFEVAPEGGSSTKFIHESISGTSHSLSSYSFDTSDDDYVSGPGMYYVTMFVKDSAGNLAQAHWELELEDLTPPTLSNVKFDGHAAGASFTAEQGDELDFSGTVRDETQLALISFEVAPEGGNSTKFIHKNISGTSHSLSSYSFDTSDDDYVSGSGTYYITMFVKDTSGNLAQAHWELEIEAPEDNTPPTLSNVKFDGRAAGASFTAEQGDELDFSGTVRDETQLGLISFEAAREGGSSIKFIHKSISGTSHSLSSYSFDTGDSDYVSGPGRYYITMFVKDAAGNLAQATWSINITAP